jgi:hypothetical protein
MPAPSGFAALSAHALGRRVDRAAPRFGSVTVDRVIGRGPYKNLARESNLFAKPIAKSARFGRLNNRAIEPWPIPLAARAGSLRE